jgi:hypothetical protein
MGGLRPADERCVITASSLLSRFLLKLNDTPINHKCTYGYLGIKSLLRDLGFLIELADLLEG